MAEDEIDELLDDSQEMDGAVHIDGFLKPLRQKRGVRGKDKAPRKRVMRAGKESEGSSSTGSAHEGDDGDDSEGEASQT
jgi:hypothetical protein